MAEKEYIERETVLREEQEIYHWCGYEDKYGNFVSVEAIRSIPAADVVEIRHAEKANSAISETGLMCTACYSDVDRDAVWCKYCGAKMDEKGDAE